MSGPPKENLLLLGATGYIGAYITDAIVQARASFGRIVVFTSAQSAARKADIIERWRTEGGVEVVVGDVRSEEELLMALEGICTVISAVGRGAIDLQIEWIKLLVKAPSVKRFFPSEYGTDIKYSPQSANEIPHQHKLKVRAAIEEVAEKSGLSYTYVVTGPFADGYLAAGNSDALECGAFNVRKKKAYVIDDGEGRVSLTTCNDVGKLAVRALLHPTASHNRALKVNSFTTTPLEIVREFERQTGGQRWAVETTPLEKVKTLEKQAYDEEKPYATLFTLRRIWAEGGTMYEKRDNGLIEEEDDMQTLEQAVQEAIAVQNA